MKKGTIVIFVSALMIVSVASGQDDAPEQDAAAELAKKLANPVASLISVPIQANYDQHIGPDEEGSTWRINFQPVVPIALNDDWNLISRTILPVVNQDDVPMAGQGESGLGDVVQSVFFSPKAPTASGWIWGVGPVLLLPTGSQVALSAEKWGAGPTAVVLKQAGPVTYGALVNHLWSFAGQESRSDVNATFIQPFLTYITKTKTTFALNTETTYDWNANQGSVPLNFNVLQLLKVGPQILQAGVGARYWADAPRHAADGWGFRATVTLLYPK